MARQCTVCRSEHRAAIDVGLVHALSPDAIKRHAKRHLSPAAAAAIVVGSKPSAIDLEALTEREGSALLVNLVAQRGRLAQLAEHAAGACNLAASIAAERATLANLEVTGKLLSRFTTRIEHKHAHVLVSAEYLAMRQALIAALRPYPEASRAAAAALHRVEADAAAKLIEHKP